MQESSRTGLLPATKRKYILVTKKNAASRRQLPEHLEATSVPLYLKPANVLLNPFAKGCSILCNHPVAPDIKQLIIKCKQTLTTETKKAQYNVHDNDNGQGTAAGGAGAALNLIDNAEYIPEDLFRRYTDTDSRPLSPAPTITSIRTRTSDGTLLNNRRCITPELGKTEMNKRKKLILDLRRSHSQETLFWRATSVADSSGHDEHHQDPPPKAQSAGPMNEHRMVTAKVKQQVRSKSSLNRKMITEEETESITNESMPKTDVRCINDQDYGDINVRRGRRRKKIKAIPSSSTILPPTGTVFHLSKDPETQISQIDVDSLNASTRPSLVPCTTDILTLMNNKDNESEQRPLEGSFLTEEAFNILKRGLNYEKIEDCFDKCLNRALREAYRYLPKEPLTTEKNNGNETTAELELNEKQIPRKFSKSAARFEVPMNLESLETMNALDYLGNYVWISNERKKLYRKVFLKYFKLKKTEEEVKENESDKVKGKNLRQSSITTYPHNEYVERFISIRHLYEALEDVLQFYGSEENIKNVLQILDYEVLKHNVKEINFRTWCGIVAFSERYIAMHLDQESDSANELEKQDFISLSLRLASYNVTEPLRKIFDVIRSTHYEEEY